MSRTRMLLSVAALFWIGGPAAYSAWPPLYEGPVTELNITAKPVPLDRDDPARTKVGALRFMGGLWLRSDDNRFGGISGMLWEEECSRILAITDTGLWVVLEPQEENGRLTGVRRAWMAPIRDADGKIAARKRDADAEALSRAADGALWVWFEQDHRGQRYEGVSACHVESLARPADRVLRLAETEGWPENGGIESAATRGGRKLVVAERAEAAGGGLEGLDFDPDVEGGGRVSRFSLHVPDGYAPTAATALDPESAGSLILVLLRRVSLIHGMSAILARAELPTFPEGNIRVEELARLASPLSVDNMEALALRPEGNILSLYIASDDNFLPIQKSLLLKFHLEQVGKETDR